MVNEIRPIDANATIEALAANFRQASVDGCDNPFYRIAEDTISEMPTVRVDHFYDLTKMVPLAMEQFPFMAQKPVYDSIEKQWFVVEWVLTKRKITGSQCYYVEIKMSDGTVFGLTIDYGEISNRFYTYYPACIDREAWTAEWVVDEFAHKCSKCGEYLPSGDDEITPQFCPSCGRATTEDALAELETRLRGERL